MRSRSFIPIRQIHANTYQISLVFAAFFVHSECQNFILFNIWLCAAKEDQKLSFQSPELTAQVFYGMIEGCLTWPALLSDGESLKYIDTLLDEIISTFLSRYECEK